jgi:hypothetical protein
MFGNEKVDIVMRNFHYTTVSLLIALVFPIACADPVADDDTGIFGGTADSSGGEPVTTDGGTTQAPADGTCGDPGTHDSSDGGVGSSSEDDGVGQICGDGIISGSEACDCGGMPCSPAGLGGEMCAGLTNPSMPDRIYTGGLLDCNPASCQFRFDTCTFCGDTIVNGNEQCELGDNTGVSCMDLGMGDGVDDLPCGLNCVIDTSSCL